MFMVEGLLLLGIISMGLAVYWHRKATRLDCFAKPLADRLGEPDISGKNHYTDCASHGWVMKNVVYGDYLRSSEGFHNFMMDRTMTGTMILGVFLGLIPVIIVYLLFQSYQLIGTSLILAVISVYILRGPGELEVSDKLAKWQMDQNLDTLSIGDLAYVRVSKRAILSWIKKLIAIGSICLVVAPWGESILPAFAYVFALVLGFIYLNIFTPISLYSMPLALLIFFVLLPSIMTFGIVAFRSLHRKMKKDDETLKL